MNARQACLALIDFTGRVITEAALDLAGPDIPKVLQFTRETVTAIRRNYNADQNARIQGLGASIASGALAKSRAQMSWQYIDEEFSGLGQSLGIATYVSTDAVAACSAELIYGLGGGMSDFAYVFIDDTVSGGLVHAGRIHFSRDSTGANMGKILVPNADAKMVPLRSLADAVGKKSRTIKQLELLARGIAFAVHSASAVVSYSAVIVDGAIASEDLNHISAILRNLLAEFGDANAPPIAVREGSHARKAAALGAACLPLADRFYPDSAH